MFDQNDVEVIQERLNVIWASASSPEIILMGRERVDLRTIASTMDLNKCTLIILYNRYRGRRYSRGVIGLAEIATSISYNRDDVRKIADIISLDPSLLSEIEGDVYQSIMSLLDIPIIIEAEIPLPVHSYISSLRTDISYIYRQLRGMMNITGRILSPKAVIGGIYYGLRQVLSDEDIRERLYNLEPPSSSRHLSREKMQDYIEWYDSKMKETLTVPEGTPTRVDQIGFYEESFKRLDEIERRALSEQPPTPASTIYRDLQVYDPQMKTERYTIHPPIDIDVVDLISSARTSTDLPLIAIHVDGKKIYKKYNNYTPDPTWFSDIENNTMRIYVRTSRTRHKYQLVKYLIDDNYFLLESKSSLLPIDDIVSILCSHLDVYWITRPETFSSSYVSISNRMSVDKDVLAWLITNPPLEYRDAMIGQYIFVKEESKPNTLKEKTNIHIQIGEDKMYISTSQGETTTGTLVPRVGRRWIGFNRGQPFLNVSVNHTPNKNYAKVCLNLYRHILAMYFKYYRTARFEIERMAMTIPFSPPILSRLIEREPSLEEQWSSIDPELYKYTSTIDPSLLPIPIDREEVDIWRSQGYSVIHLPTIITNYLYIDIPTSEEIWIRTPRPGKFILTQKSNNEYIPILYTGRGFGIILKINDNNTVIGEVQEIRPTQDILGETSSTFGKVGRFVAVPESLSMFLIPLVLEGTTIYRYGITPNILINLNDITRSNVTNDQLARYAYLCKQENWAHDVREIESDIRSGRIDPLRHIRALEEMFHLNIYIIHHDPIEPYIVKPPHSMFYLHRRGNPKWENVLFFIMENETTLIIRRDNRTSKITYTYKAGDSIYLDSMMEQSNVIRMISPLQGTSQILTYQTPPSTLGVGWDLFEQVIDDMGKVRGVTYRNRNMVATIYIGFSPIISPINGRDIPIGKIVTPSMRGKIPAIVGDIRWMNMDFIMRPEITGSFEIWRKEERDGRVLRAVVLLLYSQTEKDPTTFIDDHIIVDPNVVYDTTILRHSLPDLREISPWTYFEEHALGMVDGRNIIVPSEETKNALLLYIWSIHKVIWPKHFPHFLVYSWDIKSSEYESVFLSEDSLLATVMMETYPIETDHLTISPVAYVLRQGNDRYLIQMGRSVDQILSIAREWIENKRNPGYSYLPIERGDDIPEVLSLTPKVDSISYITYNGHPFLIIPLQ